MKSRFTILEFPVIHYIVHVEVSSDIARTMQKYPQTKCCSDHFNESTEAIVVHDTSDGFSFMFLPYTASVSTIAHESWHVVKHMMEHVSIELDNETVAYHLGYLVDKVFKFLHKGKS